MFHNFGSLKFCKIEIIRWKFTKEMKRSNMSFIIEKDNFFESTICLSNYEVYPGFVRFNFMVFTFMMFGCCDPRFSSTKDLHS